jgi:hypothetical protein
MLEWSLRSYISEQPVMRICNICVIDITKALLSTPDALKTIPPEKRRYIAQVLKASMTKEAETQFVTQTANDNATAKRLLS